MEGQLKELTFPYNAGTINTSVWTKFFPVFESIKKANSYVETAVPKEKKSWSKCSKILACREIQRLLTFHKSGFFV